MRRTTLLKTLLLLCALVVGNVSAWADTYEQLTSIANIDESAEYVLGIDGTGFHYEGTSSWGKTALPSAQTPIKYTLTKAQDGNSFTAQATISGTTYYLQVPTSNTFSMATSAGTNTDLIIGTTQVSGTNYAVANKTTTARHLRINGTSGLRSYAGTTGTMAFFYKIVCTPAVNGYTVDFENEATAYSDWTFTNIVSNYKYDGLDPRGGLKYGHTGGKSTGSIQTKEKVNPASLTCYVSKQSTNTTTSTWYVQVSSDGSNWTNAGSRSASDMTMGEWKEFTVDLSNYSDVYVRVYYSGSTAIRLIDDLTLVLSTEPSIVVEPATVNASFEGVEDGDGVLSVSYENIPELISFDIQFCDANGDELEGDAPDWLNVELQEPSEGEYKVYYNIDPNEGEARTAYFKVYTFVGDDLEEVYSNIVTITQAAYVPSTTYTLASGFTSGKHYVIAASTATTTKAMGGKNASKNYYDAIEASLNENTITVTPNSGIQEFVIYGPNADGYYTIYDPVERGYLYASSSSSNDLSYQTTNDANGLWEIDFENETVTAKGSNTHNMLRYNSSSPRFSCYASGQTAIMFYEKDGEATPTESRTLNEFGYATYCSQNALDFTNVEGVTAWAITGVNGETITFSQIIGKVPAGTGMLLKGAANASVTMTSATGAPTVPSGNLLKGTLAPMTINDNEYFGLSGNTFVPVLAGTVPAGKALLPVSDAPESSRLTFVFEDATGIATVEQSPLNDNRYYNLSGQRVDSPKKGLYIVNGKKVVVK